MVTGLAPTPAEFGRQRSESVCFCTQKACVPIYLVGGVSTYKHVLYKHVCVCMGHMYSPSWCTGWHFLMWGVCFVCSNVCVYCVCVHTHEHTMQQCASLVSTYTYVLKVHA